MELSRESSVIIVDLATTSETPSTYDELLRHQSGRFSEEGIIRPWYVVLIDDLEKLADHKDLYHSVLTSLGQPRLVLILRKSPKRTEKDGDKLKFPSFMRDNYSRLRIVLLSSSNGIDWAPGSHLPAGLAYWESDLDGAQTTAVLKESLGSDEILDDLFTVTSDVGHQVWSIGTKQVWFGRLPATATADSLFTCGHELVGDDGKGCLIPQAEEWKVPPSLSGLDIEADILISGEGTIVTQYEIIRSSVSKQKRIFGLSGRVGSIARMSKFPEHHVSELRKISGLLKTATNDVRGLLETTDATDGFDVEERTNFQKLGIQQQRKDNLRQKYLDIDTKLNEEIVNGARKSIATGHSISPVIVQVENVIKQITPKTKSEILDEFEKADFSSLIAVMDKASGSVPKNPILPIAKGVARIIEPIWLRFLLAFFYAWLVAIAVFEAFDDGNSSGFYPLPEIIRRSIARSVVVVCLGVTLAILLIGIALVVADNAIRGWSRKSGLLSVERAVEDQKSFVERVALNEWVLNNTRRKTINNLRQFRRTLELIALKLKAHLIDKRDDLASVIDNRNLPNPSVRKDLNDVAGAGVFRQLDRVVEIIRTDVSMLIDNVMALKVHEFKGISENVPEQIAESIERNLTEYVKKLVEYGPLDFNLALNEASLAKRKELSENYWTKVGLVTTAVEDTVLLSKDEQFIQFVHPDDLLQLDQQATSAVFLRFAPEPSRTNIKTRIADVDNLCFTTNTACAGIFRLVGFRDSILEYEESTQI